MPRKKVVRFNITPQTHVRATQGDAIFFQIPEDKLLPEGLKRKQRLVQYNEYKRDLQMIAEHLGFVLPDSGFSLTFLLPVPRSWRNIKKQAHHLQPHLSKPDADNLTKAFMDALRKRDSSIWDYRVQKRWVNAEEGCIEIREHSVHLYQ